jgi:NAD(P)-dependent dehydrogenase (short-subunit alcohol dehydrogenase family)
MTMGRLDGKTAMITGAGGEHGLGRAIARRFADEGADLIVTDVAPTGLRVSASTLPGSWRGLDAVVEEIQKRDRRALAAIVDVRSSGQITAAVDRALHEFGRIDVLVNNAGAPGSFDRTLVVDLGEEAWDTVLDTNLKGTFLCSQIVARSMVARGVRGRIINMSSQWGKKGGARRAAYCASKFGIIGFTQSLAVELAPAGITVNAICPSAVETERLDHMGLTPDGSFDPTLRERRIHEVGAATPVGRVARPSDVAEVAAFLAGDAAEYITGQAINVTGGGVMH